MLSPSKKILLALVALFLVCAAYAFFIEPYLIKNTRYSISSKEIPDSFNDKKIVFISDIHHGPLFSQTRVKKLVQRINSLSPDIILLGGDYVSKDIKYIDSVFAELKNLRANIGIYGVLGNHDNYESGELTKEYMRRAGFHVLDNTAEWIEISNEKIRVGGIGDIWTEPYDISPTIERTKKEDFVILLSHIPDFAEKMPKNIIDLILSGHTHGGQITFFGLWAPITFSDFGQKYRSGIISKGGSKIIVSRGIGTEFFRARFFAWPEISVIMLKSEK